MLKSTSNPTKAGFTFLEILVVVAIIALLAWVLTGSISREPHSSKAQTCAIHLEVIEGAKSIWMLDAKKSTKDIATEADLAPLLKNNAFPTCPSGGVYTINPNNVLATCSFHKVAAIK